MSRPFVFSQEVAKQVIEKLRDGETQEQAARAVGVTRSTLLRWLREGRKGVPKFAEFAREYRDIVVPQQQEHAEDTPPSSPEQRRRYKWSVPQYRDEESDGAGHPISADHAASGDYLESRQRMLNQCLSMRDELGMLKSDVEAQYQAARVHRQYVNYEIDRLRKSIDVLVDAARTEMDAIDRIKQTGPSGDGTAHKEQHT